MGSLPPFFAARSFAFARWACTGKGMSVVAAQSDAANACSFPAFTYAGACSATRTRPPRRPSTT